MLRQGLDPCRYPRLEYSLIRNTLKVLRMNNENKTRPSDIDETFLSNHMMTCDKEQIIEILISTLKNEERHRRELDNDTGPIR